jgi:hypothetical protein
MTVSATTERLSTTQRCWRKMLPNGSSRSARWAAAASRFACRAVRRRDGSTNSATPTMASRFPWPRVHWFWGEELFIPQNDPHHKLSDGAGRFALPGPDSHWQYSPDPDRGPVGGGGRRVHGDIEEVLWRRRACVGPAVVRGDAAWDRRKWTHRLIVPRTPGIAGEAAVASRRSARTPGLASR